MERLSVLLFCAALAACHQQKAAPAAPKIVRPAAEAPMRTMDSGQGATTFSTEAPESEGGVKRLGRDPVNNCDWLETEGLVTVGDQDSRAQARAGAQAEARKRAMEAFLGVTVTEKGFDFQQETLRDQQQLVENILQTTRNGRILDEKVVDEGYISTPDCPSCRYHMRLRSCLVQLPDEKDRDFQVDLDLSRTKFVDGDEATIKVSATQDCYVYLYDVGMDGETSLIVPNEYVREIHLKPGDTFEYPNEQVRDQGVKLVAQLPQGKDVSAETIRLIATKSPLPKDRQDPAMGGYLGLLRRMNASRLDWTDTAQAFTIYKH